MKPSVAAWTVNQLARRRGARVRDLLAAGEAVRKAQEQALKGKGGDALREAAQRERELVTQLRREARGLLDEDGRSANDALLERVAATLSNAAVDPDARELLEAGRLTEEVEASGFDAFAGMSVPSAPVRRPAAKPKSEPKPSKPPKGEAAAKRRQAAQLRARARDLEREARAAEKEAERAAADAARAAKRAEESATAADEAAEAARGARAAADEARAEADAAD